MNFNFQDLPQHYKCMLNEIFDDVIINSYSKFKFLYFYFPSIYQERYSYSKYISKYLKDSKFITYHISNILPNALSKKLYDKEKLTSLIMCIEEKCLIIEQIDLPTIIEIINELEKTNKLLLNMSSDLSIKITKTREYEKKAKIEINNFCQSFMFQINKNPFVKHTINSIAGYLIRRYFCPTNFFHNQTFFNYDKNNASKEHQDKKEFVYFLFKKNISPSFDLLNDVKKIVKYQSYDIAEQNKIEDFDEKDFIILDTVTTTEKAFFYLVIHRQSLYIFLMKIAFNPEFENKYFRHEVEFCEFFSHRCLTKFYGFLKKNGKKIGFIYEYMSNGTLYEYYSSKKNEINEIFIKTSLNRIIKGIDYLHSNSFIHRDLKPLNILINHDNLLFISDFDTITRVKNNNNNDFNKEEKTNDLGSILYSSPEQNNNDVVSYPSDIYSFGLIIYYLYVKKDLYFYDGFNLNKRNDENILPICNCSENMMIIYKQCLNFNQSERPKIQQIKNIINEECKFISSNLLIESLNSKSIELIHFLYENITSSNESKEDTELYFLKILEQKYSFILFYFGVLYQNGANVNQDYSRAKKYFELSAQNNNSNALLHLGILHENGDGIEQNYQKAKEYYELSAGLNNHLAQYNLGILYENGIGVKQDYLEAKHYYELSAQQNFSGALCNLGSLYEYGKGVKKDYKKAIQYYELSAQQNNSNALLNLGNIYYNGHDTKQDYSKAKYYYELAQQQDNPVALFNLALLFEYGQGVQKDYEKALKYFELSAQLNNSDALLKLGFFYHIGHTVKQDYSKAKYYFELAAKQNNSDGLLNLGFLYQYGLSVEKNYSKAKFYYELAAKLDNSNAFLNLGILYFNGYGVKQDFLKAKYYFELSALQNNSNAFVNLGVLYEHGKGVKRDYIKAKYYYELSAQQNNSVALLNLGILYDYGYGVKQNYSEAKYYYELSARQNNSNAFVNLGILYEYGRGVKLNYSKAKYYNELAARQNNSNALLNLGIFYENGKGVEQNYVKAKQYYELSTQQNNSIAYWRLALLYIFGYGVKKNYLKAKIYIELAAKFNNLNAINLLGILHREGFVLNKNCLKAKQYFELSASQNNSDGLNFLGELYYDGDGVNQDYSKALKYFVQSAQQNNPYAYLNLGKLHFHEYGVQKDKIKANKYYELAAEFGNHYILYELGQLYEYGIDIEKNYSKAFEYYKSSQENSESLLQLGNFYFYGYIVAQDYHMALHYYSLSSSKNNSEAFLKIGKMHFHGYGIPKNYSEAKKNYEISASLHNADAFLKLGKLYENGFGVEKNYKIALKYYEISSQFNYSKSFLKIGKLYEKVYSLQDIQKAKKYYELAAQFNNPEAQFYLGNFYSFGEYFPIDISKAIDNYTKSFSNDHIKYKIFDPVFIYREKRRYNKFVYIANNNLGLIYITILHDIENAGKFLKVAAFNEYPFGQNNFGLYYQYFFPEKIDDAKYFYKKALRNHFAIAGYNLGYLYEKENNIQESIKYYIEASKNEDEPMTFKKIQICDKKLEISKIFILCLTNLKLTKHFLAQSEYKIAKEYFIKSFHKIEINNKQFNYKFQFEFIKSFSFLRSYIFDCSLFKFKDLNLKFYEYDHNDSSIGETEKNVNLKLNIKEIGQQNNSLQSKIFEKNCSSNLNNENMIRQKVIFNSLGCLFDFAIENTDITTFFINEIDTIIKEMTDILHKPPYYILFGRICIDTIHQKEESQNVTKYNLNKHFYEGFWN